MVRVAIGTKPGTGTVTDAPALGFWFGPKPNRSKKAVRGAVIFTNRPVKGSR